MRLGKMIQRARKSPLYPVIGIVATQVLVAILNSRRLKQLEARLTRRVRA